MRTTAWMLLLFSASLMAFQAPQNVNISLSGSSVVVSPDPAVLNAGGKVRWNSSGNPSDRIEIVFQSSQGKQGPFPSDRSRGNPSRGRYSKRVGSPIVTLGATDRGEWKYDVIWVKADGSRYRLDPIIVIR